MHVNTVLNLRAVPWQKKNKKLLYYNGVQYVWQLEARRRTCPGESCCTVHILCTHPHTLSHANLHSWFDMLSCITLRFTWFSVTEAWVQPVLTDGSNESEVWTDFSYWTLSLIQQHWPSFSKGSTDLGGNLQIQIISEFIFPLLSAMLKGHKLCADGWKRI